MKTESSGTSKYIFISLNVPVFIHMSAQRQWCKPKQPLHCVKFGSVGSVTDFNTKGPEFDPSLGMSNVFRKLFKANRIIYACVFLVLLNCG